MLNLNQKQRHGTNTEPVYSPPKQPITYSSAALSTCAFASVEYMQIWLKEFSSSISSLSIPAPYFPVIHYYGFWTQHVVRSNCIVSTDHFCCIFFTTDVGSSAHTLRLNEIRGIGFHLPLLNWSSSCNFISSQLPSI